MLEIIQSDDFARWLKKLRDRQAKARIEARIQDKDIKDAIRIAKDWRS